MQGESRAFRKKQKKESFFAWLNTLKPSEKKIPGTDLGSCVRSKYFALLPFFLESVNNASYLSLESRVDEALCGQTRALPGRKDSQIYLSRGLRRLRGPGYD